MTNIMGNLYYNTVFYYPFKDVHGLHYSWNRNSISRTHHRIIDLKLWFESDFEEGEVLVVERVSGNGKYFFPEHHMRCFE